MEHFLPVFKWFSESWAAHLVAGSNWLFPAIEAVHIVALTVLVGAIFFMDLQMLGIVRRNTSLSKLAGDLDPWAFSSLIIILGSGILLFSSEALKLYNSAPFQLKMVLLLLAIVFNFTIHRWVTGSDEERINPILTRITAVVSMGLWLSVGLCGRAIGFF